MSCITYINNEPSGLDVIVSGRTCTGVIGSYTLTQGQAVCMDNDYDIITCGNVDLGAECINPITPSPTPTINLTSTPTPSITTTPSSSLTPTPTTTTGLTPTPTPDLTTTPTPTNTLTATPSQTPSGTPSITQTQTPTGTPQITNTPTGTSSITPTPTGTSSITPTPTPTSAETGTQLLIYTKYINNPSPGDLQYSINSGTPAVEGPISSTSCDYMFTIYGLQIGDTVEFSDTSTYVIAGSTTVCPSGPGGFGCIYSYSVLTTGTEYLYLTVDGDTAC